jgi:hypothetical protein
MDVLRGRFQSSLSRDRLTGKSLNAGAEMQRRQFIAGLGDAGAAIDDFCCRVSLSFPSSVRAAFGTECMLGLIGATCRRFSAA